MARSNSKKSHDTEPFDLPKEETKSAPSAPQASENEAKEQTLELLQNFYVNGKLAKKGSQHTFPLAEARKRLSSTNGVWTTLSK